MIIYRPIQTPKAITFDLDDTLYDNWPIIRAAEQALAQYLQQHHPAIAQGGHACWLAARRYCIEQNPKLASDMTRLRKAVLIKLAGDVGYSASAQEDVAEAGYQIFYNTRSDFKINETIYSLLETLSETCKLVAITNGNVDLNKVGIAHLFERSFQASVTQPMKPDATMFRAAIEQLELPPSQILHVGDHLIKDVWGAHQLGIHTAWYAINRPMRIQSESARILPSMVLHQLTELLLII